LEEIVRPLARFGEHMHFVKTHAVQAEMVVAGTTVTLVRPCIISQNSRRIMS
jgi:hypothetical protein